MLTITHQFGVKPKPNENEFWYLSDSPVVFNLYLGLVQRDEGHARLDCATWFHSEGQTFGKDYSS